MLKTETKSLGKWKLTQILYKTDTSNIVNIYNGCVADEHVNVHNVIDTGEEMKSKLRQNLPGGFHTPLQKIVTMESLKHTVRLGDTVAVYAMKKRLGGY